MLGGRLGNTQHPSGSLSVTSHLYSRQAETGSPGCSQRTTYLSAERPSAARLNLAAGTLPSFYLLPKRASENNSKTSRSFRPRLSPTTGRRVPIKLHQQASHRFQSNTLNRDMHTKPAANYTKGPASAQRPLGSKRSSMNGSGYSTGSPTHTALDSTVITLRSSKRN